MKRTFLSIRHLFSPRLLFPVARRNAMGASFFSVALAGLIWGGAAIPAANAANATWNQTTGGAWGTGSNWTGGAAPGNTSSGATATSDVATFGSSLSSTSSISVDAGRTIRSITFSNTGQLTLGTVAGSALYLSDGGTIQKSSGGTFARINAPVRLTGSSTFTSNSGYLTLGSTVSGAVNNVAHTLTLNGSVFSYYNQLEAAISNGTGTVAITKTGTGAWSLDGANTYTGATTISNGTLLINGSLASGSAVAVASGATVGGSGAINGTVLVDGSVSPGALSASTNGSTIGSLSVANDVTWNSGDAWKFQLGTSSGASDQLLLTGAGHDFLKGSGAEFSFNFLNTGVAGTFTLVDWAAATTFSSTDFTYTGLASGLTGAFAINGSQLDFVVTAVPEPSAYSMLLAFGLMFLFRRRRLFNSSFSR